MRIISIQGSHTSWKILESPGIFIRIFRGPKTSWKMTGPGKSWKSTCKVLESWNLLGNDVHVCFRFQIDMFMQTKMALIVSITYVFWAAGMQKMLSWPGFSPGTRWQSLQRSPRLLSCCSLPYLNIVDLQRCPGKMFGGLEKSWIFL